MKARLLAPILFCTANAMATSLSFDADTVGHAPSGWTCGATGKGAPRWSVETDAATTPPRRVLRQSGAAPFPWCVKSETALADGWVAEQHTRRPPGAESFNNAETPCAGAARVLFRKQERAWIFLERKP